MFVYFLVLHYFISNIYSDAACTWPVEFANSTWVDSLKGDMVFESSTMTGWSFDVNIQTSASVQTLDTWECVTYDETGPYLIMKTVDTFTQFITEQYTGYRCIILEKITHYSYRYYQTEPIQVQLDHERVIINPSNTLSDPTVLCTYPSSGGEFQVMVEKGSEAIAKVSCPYNLLSDYTFTYSMSDGAVSCDPVTDVGGVNMCTNVTEISAQPPACSPYPLYTSGTSSWCVDVVTVGSDTFVSLLNAEHDSAVANTYQFVCLGINSDGTSLSVSPQHCKAGQTPTILPVDNSGAESGAVWNLSPSGDPCPPCPILSDPFRGSVNISTNGAVTIATYACDGTYSLSGNETRVCQTNGDWSDSEPSCACSIPSSMSDGDVDVTNGGLTVSFTCDAGFVLVGTSTLTCNTVTNIWSDTYPSCDVCQTLGTPTDGSVTFTSDGLTTVATYSCDVGSTLNGDSSRTCKTDTTWTKTAPTCTSCPALSDIPSGNVTLDTDSTITIATYYCAPGYSISGDKTTECTISGTWDTIPPSCECDDPSTPDNGTVTVSDDKTQAVYTCNLGFTLQGVSIRSCQVDGTGWSSNDPICVGCPLLSEPTNGNVSLSTDGTRTVATYSCHVGYTLKGGAASECQTDGSWASTAPTCTQCDVVPTISSATYTLVSDGSTTSAQYSCSVGTTLSGDVTIACDVNGVWSVSSGTTSCVECPALSTTGGTYSISTDGATSTAELVCENGYTLENSGSIECLSNGTWSSSSDTSQCVSTAPSTESKSSSDTLLPAVIALAVIAAIFTIAFGLAMFYIWKLKKNISGNTKDKKIHENGMNTSMFSSLPPRGHSQHIMDIRNTSSAMSAPINYMSSPRVDSVTPRSLSSSTSNSSLHLSHLNLIREETTLDQNTPAPWSKKATQKDQNGSSLNSKSSIFPPISENAKLVTPRGTSSTEHNHTRKKKLSFGKKIQRQNSSEVSEVDNNTNKDKIPKTSQVKSNKVSSLYTDRMNSVSSAPKTGGGVGNGGSAVPKLRLSDQPQRASTPVKHHMEIKEPNSCSTPRSNTFTTVQ